MRAICSAGADGVLKPSPPPKPANRYFRELGAAYVKALRGYSAQAQRITDKMPDNYFDIGMIHLCLPNAVILHSVRDPVDTCLGCYKQIFATGHETTYDLTLMGKTYVLYRRLMEHWNRVLPGRVVDVVYENLVADPETEIRRLLAACGLPWNDACLRLPREPAHGEHRQLEPGPPADLQERGAALAALREASGTAAGSPRPLCARARSGQPGSGC